MIFRREVIGQFHCKLLLTSEIAKAEAIVVEPVKRKTSEVIVICSSYSQIEISIDKNFAVQVQHCEVTRFDEWQTTEISIVNKYFVRMDFHTALGFAII